MSSQISSNGIALSVASERFSFLTVSLSYSSISSIFGTLYQPFAYHNSVCVANTQHCLEIYSVRGRPLTDAYMTSWTSFISPRLQCLLTLNCFPVGWLTQRSSLAPVWIAVYMFYSFSSFYFCIRHVISAICISHFFVCRKYSTLPRNLQC